MSDVSQGHGWWLASDDKWYPPSSTLIIDLRCLPHPKVFRRLLTLVQPELSPTCAPSLGSCFFSWAQARLTTVRRTTWGSNSSSE